MPKIHLDLPKLRFKKHEYFKTLQREAEQVFREGAAVFAKRASKRVPVWTGMARGSFLAPVRRFTGARGTSSNYLGLTDSPGSIDITSARSRAIGKNGRRPMSKRGKLPRLSTGEIKNKEAGKRRSLYYFENKNGLLIFKFNSEVFHYNILETTHIHNSKTSPWHSMEIGRRYFLSYVNKEIPKRLRKKGRRVKDFIVRIKE